MGWDVAYRCGWWFFWWANVAAWGWLMATLADFRTRVSAKLGLDNTAASAEQLLIDSWCNEAVEQILVRTRCYVASGTLSYTTSDAQLPSTVLAIQDLYNADNVPLEQITPQDVLTFRRGVQVTSTLPWRYALNGSLVMIYPTPTASGSLTMLYVPRPTAMTTGANDPSTTTYGGIPSEWHKLIEFYALAEGSDYDDDQTGAQGERYRQMFELHLARMHKALNTRGGRVRPRFKIPNQVVFWPSPDTDVYHG